VFYWIELNRSTCSANPAKAVSIGRLPGSGDGTKGGKGNRETRRQGEGEKRRRD
jgi:hypothetical protein